MADDRQLSHRMKLKTFNINFFFAAEWSGLLPFFPCTFNEYAHIQKCECLNCSTHSEMARRREEITAAATDNIQNSPHECNINVARHWCMTISVL